MLRIVTDGGADYPTGWLEKYEIHVLPLRITFGDITYLQGRDIDSQKFYQLVKETGQIPHTSLPSPGQIVDFYRSIATPQDSILSIHLGSKMSGTFATVKLAAEEMKDEIKVFAFDSGAGSAAEAFMCREARLMERAGKSMEDILARLRRMRDQLTVIFTLDTLEFARMNGRVNALQSAITSMLRVKPIILLRDGLLQMGDKVRTRQRSLEHIVELARQSVGNLRVNIAVVHAADAEAAQTLTQKILGMFNISEVVQTDLAIPVAANLGPGTVGLIIYPVEEES